MWRIKNAYDTAYNNEMARLTQANYNNNINLEPYQL